VGEAVLYLCSGDASERGGRGSARSSRTTPCAIQLAISAVLIGMGMWHVLYLQRIWYLKFEIMKI
jgi:hypothetical protein